MKLPCLKCFKKEITNYCAECSLNTNQILKENLCFDTLKEAGEYFNTDFRTVKRYTNTLFKLKGKTCKLTLDNCNICSNIYVKRRNETLMCRDCFKSKEHLKLLLPEKYKGKNNPNYIHGKSTSTEYQLKRWRNLRDKTKKDFCELCDKTNREFHLHHIIPRSFCKYISKEEMIYDENNLITLCLSCHTGVHHLKLDLAILPNLYSQYKHCAQELKITFLHQSLTQQVLRLDEKELLKLDLFLESKYLGCKTVLPVFQKAVLWKQDLVV